jgi:tRNA dimethylallyltransferase
VIEAVLIAGATASGKSAAAMAVARATGGVIVNADSMQVYRELPILSAMPDPADRSEVEHRLFGVVSAFEHFSVARWLAAVRETLAELKAQRRLAIVTGGTGLYFRALEHGLNPSPESDPDIRALARGRREELGPDAFHAELVGLDPGSAHLSPGDTQRTLRAWEVVTQTGRSLADWNTDAVSAVLPAHAMLRVVIELDRDVLYERIDRRFDAMLAAGALDEARAFWAAAPDPLLPAAKALGLPQFRRALAGEIPLDEAVADAKMQTRRFAKRQGTWFRNQTPDWLRIDGAGDAGAAVLDALNRSSDN